MRNSTKVLLASAAVTGLFIGATARASNTVPVAPNNSSSAVQKSVKSLSDQAGTRAMADEPKADDKHDCKGKNDCKGKGGCKTGDNGCKGKNSCKGKGGCSTKEEKK